MRHEIFKFLHVIGAITWVGSGIGISVLGTKLRTGGDLSSLAAIYRRAEDLGKMLFAPAALLTLGFGIAMVATTAAIGFGDLWIVIGFAGVIGSGVMENAIAGPANKKFLAAMEAGRIEAASGHAKRALLGNWLDVAVLVVVVWAMVARPLL